MKKIIPLLIIVAIVSFFFKPLFLHQTLPIPSDTIVGLYYPFRDLYVKTNPNGLPFKNFLITDPVRQQYPWRNLAIDLEKKIQLPLWNPYSFSGAPLLANFQSAVFYPLNILFFLLPFSFAWSVLIVLEPLLGGLFLYLYLKNLKLHPLASLLGAITFSFSGFFVAWMEWSTVLQTALWLPLILLSIDKLFFSFQENAKIKKSFQWFFIFLFSLVASFFAGHLQTFFYLFLITVPYLILRWFQNGKDKKSLSVFFLLTSCFLLLTAVQWIPTLQFINLSARNIDQNWHQAGWFIPWQNLLQFVTPDFFGNPATGNYWGVWNYAEFVGYVGIVPLLLSLFALFFRHDRKTLFFGTLFFLSLLFSLPTMLAQLPFMLSLPFLSTAQPTRLLFITDFSLAILTALGLDYFIRAKKKEMLYPIGFLSLVFAGIWTVVFFNTKIHLISPENIVITKHNIVLPTMLFVISALLFIVVIYGRPQGIAPTRRNLFVVMCLLIAITAFDLLRFADKFETFASTSYLYPSTKVTSFLQKNIGLSRMMTTDDRILPPNFSVMYHLQSVDGYDPLYLLQYGELLAASERKKPDITPPFGFNRIITPHNYDSSIINLLGVKYILSLSDIQNTHLQKVFQDGQTIIYENKQVLPRAFLVSNIVHAKNDQEAITLLFSKSFDLRKQAVITSPASLPFLSGTGIATITNYSENNIAIQTNATAESFLVLTDMDYPTWSVAVDGKDSMIFTTDFAFRGVIVPKGKHTVQFENKLF